MLFWFARNRLEIEYDVMRFALSHSFWAFLFVFVFVLKYEMWFCIVVVDFFNRINVIYGVVCEFCTEESCPVMSGGPKSVLRRLTIPFYIKYNLYCAIMS